jgi:hypothetical protein
VPTPASLPSDFPVYPGARLVFRSPESEFELDLLWESLDSVDQVRAFYAGRLTQGDWTIFDQEFDNGVYYVYFARKSDGGYGGAVTAGINAPGNLPADIPFLKRGITVIGIQGLGKHT